MARLVTKTELAKIAGVAKPQISKLVRRCPGVVNGLRVDLDHPDVQRYLADKDGAATRIAEALANPPSILPAPLPATTPSVLVAKPAQLKGAERRATGATDKLTKPADVDLASCLDMTLREVFEHFGTMSAFIDVLDATRRVADITERNLKIAERSGRLISRDFVRTHVFSHLDALSRRLLTDMPATLVRKARANLPLEEAEAKARELISSQLKQAKDEITRALSHGEQHEERAA